MGKSSGSNRGGAVPLINSAILSAREKGVASVYNNLGGVIHRTSQSEAIAHGGARWLAEYSEFGEAVMDIVAKYGRGAAQDIAKRVKDSGYTKPLSEKQQWVLSFAIREMSAEKIRGMRY